MSKHKQPERSTRELELEDMLSDLLDGFRVWRDGKIGHGDWTEKDEMLLRWVEGSPGVQL
jgi:hypothetical protein